MTGLPPFAVVAIVFLIVLAAAAGLVAGVRMRIEAPAARRRLSVGLAVFAVAWIGALAVLAFSDGFRGWLWESFERPLTPEELAVSALGGNVRAALELAKVPEAELLAMCDRFPPPESGYADRFLETLARKLGAMALETSGEKQLVLLQLSQRIENVRAIRQQRETERSPEP